MLFTFPGSVYTELLGVWTLYGTWEATRQQHGCICLHPWQCHCHWIMGERIILQAETMTLAYIIVRLEVDNISHDVRRVSARISIPGEEYKGKLIRPRQTRLYQLIEGLTMITKMGLVLPTTVQAISQWVRSAVTETLNSKGGSNRYCMAFSWSESSVIFEGYHPPFKGFHPYLCERISISSSKRKKCINWHKLPI